MTPEHDHADVNVHRQPGCVACGADNPAGLHGTFVASDDEIHGTMVVTDAMLGPGGRLHNGALMVFLDEALGLTCLNRGVDAMTANLQVDHHASAYAGAVLTERAWVERHEGRKWYLRAEVHEGDRLLAEARGLWVVPRAH